MAAPAAFPAENRGGATLKEVNCHIKFTVFKIACISYLGWYNCPRNCCSITTQNDIANRLNVSEIVCITFQINLSRLLLSSETYDALYLRLC